MEVLAQQGTRTIFATPLRTEGGQTLGPINVTFETYGELNSDKSNVILLLHALTGNAHAGGKYFPDDQEKGWWDPIIGPNRAIDTSKYFIISPNILGSCYGTTGPCSINPQTGKPYGMSFPIITIRDMIMVQKELLDQLGIKHLYAVIGGSMGGMQVLQWAVSFPEFMDKIISIGACGRLYPQAIAFNEVGRQAIVNDPQWKQGNYYPYPGPSQGLAIARMLATITYRSDISMNERFGRNVRQGDEEKVFTMDSKFEVEDYLHYHGRALVKRFDANCYLYLTKAMDLHDVSRGYPSYDIALDAIKANTLMIGISTDILFPTYQQQEIVATLKKKGKEANYWELESPHGHDAFLIEFRKLGPVIQKFLG